MSDNINIRNGHIRENMYILKVDLNYKKWWLRVRMFLDDDQWRLKLEEEEEKKDLRRVISKKKNAQFGDS